ncbi:hypothetical protein [Heyndrickxia faecalis]|uniref:hypothetical protein n=1 Tax=Heyndrickxia TaxID=2837504 RepID=UPI003D2081D5
MCQAPAHSLRKSRHSGTFIIPFQPRNRFLTRWVYSLQKEELKHERTKNRVDDA